MKSTLPLRNMGVIGQWWCNGCQANNTCWNTRKNCFGTFWTFPIWWKKGAFHLKPFGKNEHAMWELLPCGIFQFDQITYRRHPPSAITLNSSNDPWFDEKKGPTKQNWRQNLIPSWSHFISTALAIILTQYERSQGFLVAEGFAWYYIKPLSG